MPFSQKGHWGDGLSGGKASTLCLSDRKGTGMTGFLAERPANVCLSDRKGTGVTDFLSEIAVFMSHCTFSAVVCIVLWEKQEKTSIPV